MNSIIKSLNMTEGAVLTLKKFSDRLEFEAFTPASGQQCGIEYVVCMVYIEDPDLDCRELFACMCDCPAVSYDPKAFAQCDCNGPGAYDPGPVEDPCRVNSL